MPKSALALVSTLALATCAHAPAAVAPEPTALQADVDTLEAIVDALHPGATRYHTPEEVHQLFADTRARLSTPRSLPEVFLELTRLTAALRCGHTYPNFTNQSKDVAAALFHGPRLPFLFRWIDGEMVITDDLGAFAALPAGTRVTSLGGVPTRAMLASLLPLARADGANDAKRRAYLEDRADSAIEAFDVLAGLSSPGLFAATNLDADAVTPDGAHVRVSIPWMTFEDHARAIAALRPEPPAGGPMWTARRIDRGGKRVVYLAMPSWVMYKTSWDWQGDLDRLAGSLVAERVDALIVDLRGNEGGNDVGDVLVAHLVDAPVAPRAMARRTRFVSVPAALRGYLDTWDRSFFELGKDSRDVGNGWRELPAADDAVVPPRAPRFTGALVVLIDAANSSATFQFAQTVRERKLGVLVGTTTGGSQRGINGGAFFFARLPHSGIEVDIPLIGTFPSTGEAPDRGIEPDVLVEPTAADLARGRDAVLEAALEVAAR